MTLVCVPILVNDVAHAAADAHAAAAAGAAMVEFRVDGFYATAADIPAVLHLLAECPIPAILTCRIEAEGGHYDGTEEDRVALFEAAGVSDHPPRYIDVELSAYERSANVRQKVHLAVDWPAKQRPAAPGLILSTHDFRGRPSDLLRRVARLAESPAEVIKVAVQARSLRDAIEMLELPGTVSKPAIALAMGEFGIVSRVFAPACGGFLTFAPLRASGATAPGQPTLAELRELYRIGGVSPGTRLYGVIGWPVTHSLSPLMHNAAFAAAEHDGVYVPLPIAGGDDADGVYAGFKGTVLEMVEHPALNFAGASVTVPHKENLVRLARERGWALDGVARDIGAANTLIIRRDDAGRPESIEVRNTDAVAVAEEISLALKHLHDRRIGVIGAGGMGRAAAYGFAMAGATVVLYNRDADRARRVAKELSPVTSGKVVAASLDLLPRACCDALINCTSVGLEGGPAPGESLLSADQFQACPTQPVVLDTVYRPRRTPLLAQAHAAGCEVLDGTGMLIRQAERQSAAWTGRTPPPGLFRRLIDERLPPESEP